MMIRFSLSNRSYDACKRNCCFFNEKLGFDLCLLRRWSRRTLQSMRSAINAEVPKNNEIKKQNL